jgi:hypothetical protein
MYKRKLVVNAAILVILFSFALQIAVFGQSVFSGRNVSGIVYASPGIPMSGAMVSALGDEGYGSALTLLNGQFTITEGLKSGNYTVFIVKEGYINAEIKDVVVTAPSQTSGVNAYLNRSGGISGRITDFSSSMGLPNVLVTAFPSSGSDAFFGTAITDVLGNYSIITNLGSGNYNVSVLSPTGYIEKTISQVSVAAGYIARGADLALERSGIISGRITTPGGQPLANLTVSAYSTGGTMYFGSGMTNATGYYRIVTGLATATYQVNVAWLEPPYTFNSTSADVTAGQETANVNLQLDITPPSASGIITGKVRDNSNSNPIVGAHVTAQGTGGSGNADTDENGNYVISSGLGTGTYTVSASATGYVTQNITNVSVTVSQETPNTNFQLSKISSAQSGKISGTITGDENPIPEFQYPIAVMLIVTLIAVVIAKSSIQKAARHPIT